MNPEENQFPALIAMLESPLDSQNEKEYWAACKRIATIGEPAIPILLDKLITGTPQVKMAILYIFEKMGSHAKSTVSVLIEFVKRPRPNDIRNPEYSLNAAAASALGEIGDSAAIPCLIDALDDTNYLCVRAALALGKIGNEQVISPLVNVLRDKDKFWVPRGAAAVALGNLGKTAHDALAALEEALHYDYESKTEKWDLRAYEAVNDAIQKIKDSSYKSKLTGHGYRFEIWDIY